MNKLICVFAILGGFANIFAHSNSIIGTVTDQDGNFLAGANVAVEGSFLGAATDSRGSFSISGVPTGTYILTASFIGYESANLSISVNGGHTQADFVLVNTALSGANVFVTGTRAAGRTAMKSPTPIDGFDNLTLRRQGNGDFTETLKNIVISTLRHLSQVMGLPLSDPLPCEAFRRIISWYSLIPNAVTVRR